MPVVEEELLHLFHLGKSRIPWERHRSITAEEEMTFTFICLVASGKIKLWNLERLPKEEAR